MRDTDRFRQGRRAAGQVMCVLFAGLMAVSEPMTVLATNTAQMERERQEAQAQLDAANDKADAAEEQKYEAEMVMAELQSELTMLIAEISLLESDIEYKEEQIEQAQKDYEAAKKKEEEQYQAMKKRIKYMYEKGETEYLDILFKVESMADLLNKSEYIADIYEYDRKMLEEYKQTKQKVEQYKAQLEYDKAEMEGMQIEFEAQKENLELTIESKRREISNFDEAYEKAKREAEIFSREVAQKNAQIRQAEEEARRKAEEEARKRAQEEARKAEEARKKAEEEARKRAEEESKAADQNRQENSRDDTPVSPGGSAASAGSTTNSSSTSYGPGGSSLKASSSYGPGMVSGSAQGRAVVDYALQFVGNPYVYGGTSLTNGADCSGFVQSVYKYFGFSLPRTSAEQRSAGRGVEYADAQPGDLICYAGHIGIYMGNGQIVHASSPKNGIKVGNATYRSILAVRRIVD